MPVDNRYDGRGYNPPYENTGERIVRRFDHESYCVVFCLEGSDTVQMTSNIADATVAKMYADGIREHGGHVFRICPAGVLIAALELIKTKGPSREWLEKMADAEDAAGSVSVGGMAADLGMLPARCAECGSDQIQHTAGDPNQITKCCSACGHTWWAVADRPVNIGKCVVEIHGVDITELLDCATEVFKNQSTGRETEFERGARHAIEYIKQLAEHRSKT